MRSREVQPAIAIDITSHERFGIARQDETGSGVIDGGKTILPILCQKTAGGAPPETSLGFPREEILRQREAGMAIAVEVYSHRAKTG